KLVATYPNLQQANLKLPGSEKKIYVYHNSSLIYKNVTIELPYEENVIFSRIINGKEIDAFNDTKIEGGKIIWTIPKL
ncbi:MAG: hypothetical protein ACTSYQ_01905, partial [Candidatus Odinarchaeia archaeon]